jgi:hypothetical protein
MKYDKETTDQLVKDYSAGVPVAAIAAQLDVPDRSVIAKLSSLGIYQKRPYLNKRGDQPIKKFEYIERLSVLLNTDLELLESLEKVNKTVLIMLEKALLEKSDPKV